MTQPIICVQGLGFVGLAMATVSSNAVDKDGNPIYRVYGVDLPNKQDSIDLINKGIIPFKTEDETFAPELKRAVQEYKNLIATTDTDVYSKASVVIVDVHLTISKTDEHDYTKYLLHKESLEKAMHALGAKINPDCLVLVETTVPPGATRNIVFPILKQEFAKRNITSDPIVAHSYERVMPGRDYLNSIRKYFRTFSGLTDESAQRAHDFLSGIIDTTNYPLRQEEAPEASEMAKVLENSFRAMNIAFIYEWTLYAEKAGVNLFSVIEGIRNRNTHKNIMLPGFGVGGYCLTKDSLLALWSNDNFYHSEFGFPLSVKALMINDHMPVHVADLIDEFDEVKGKKVLILGVSYREDVGDTRFSPTEILYKEIVKRGGFPFVHDPYVNKWDELPEATFVTDTKGYDIVVFATRHECYLKYTNEELEKISENTSLIVDANNILDDEKISQLMNQGKRVIGVGKGNINKKCRKQ